MRVGITEIRFIEMDRKTSKRVSALTSDGKCLSCEVDAEHLTRGLCSACYQATRRAIRTNKKSEAEFVAEGKYLSLDDVVFGRPPKNPVTKRLRESV